MESTALATFLSHLDDQVADVDLVAELAELHRDVASVVEVLSLAVDNLEAVEGTLEAEITADDADIAAHDLLDLLVGLRDKNHLLVVDSSGVVPVGDVRPERREGSDLDRVLGGDVGIDERFEETIGRETVGAVEASTGALAGGVEVADRGASVEIHLDAAAEVVGSRGDRDILLSDVDSDRETLLVDHREVSLRLLGVLVSHVEVDAGLASYLHLVVDSTGDDVARSEAATLVVLLHEGGAILVAEDAAVAAHSLGDEEARLLARVVETRRVELDELHTLDNTLGAEGHSDAVTRGDRRVRRDLVDVADAAGSHHSHLAEERHDDSRLLVEDVGAVALNILHPRLVVAAEVVLSDDVDSEVILEDINVRVVLNLGDECALDLLARVVLMVEDSELRVASLLVEVELAVFLTVEHRAPFDELLNLLWGHRDNLADHFRVADAGAGDMSVSDMLLEVVWGLEDGGDTTLRLARVSHRESSLRDEGYAAGGSHLEGVGEASCARAYDEEIV